MGVPLSPSPGHASNGLGFTESSGSPKTGQSPKVTLMTPEGPLKTIFFSGVGPSQSHVLLWVGRGLEGEFYQCSNKGTKRQGSEWRVPTRRGLTSVS